MLYLAEIVMDSKCYNGTPYEKLKSTRSTVYFLVFGFGKGHAYDRTKKHYDKTFGELNEFICITIRSII